MSILQINIRLSQNKTPDLDIYQSHLFSKVEQDNEIQPPESRDAIGKLSNKKKTMRLYIKIRVYIQILYQFLGLSNKQKKNKTPKNNELCPKYPRSNDR